jgi:sugar O-acyltransferase (sialic acid O-acetyltransferase NeuD family)
MSKPIRIPLINPNEPEALLAGLFVSEGQFVNGGAVLCTLETTKSTADLEAEGDGYIVGLRYTQGYTVRSGDILCYLAESPDWTPPVEDPAPDDQDAEQLPPGLRITQPALALARQAGLDLNALPDGKLVTEALVKEHIGAGAGDQPEAPESEYDASAILVYGGGGHGKSLIDLIRILNIYQIKGILDDGIPKGEMVMGVPVLGGAERLGDLYDQGVRQAVNAVGGIGNVAIRIEVYSRLAQAGFVCPTVIHPTAFVEPGASIQPGCQVFPHAYVGSEVQVGFGSIVNTNAVVSHECILGDYTNISPGAILAGGVHIGDTALVGMGVTVNLLVKIGAGARIGNGATVKEDVPENGIVRAGGTWPG